MLPHSQKDKTLQKYYKNSQKKKKKKKKEKNNSWIAQKVRK
jgi:hypothetical protein